MFFSVKFISMFIYQMADTEVDVKPKLDIVENVKQYATQPKVIVIAIIIVILAVMFYLFSTDQLPMFKKENLKSKSKSKKTSKKKKKSDEDSDDDSDDEQIDDLIDSIKRKQRENNM